MDTAFIDDIKLEYEVLGTGEPVVFIHGALIADSFRSLLTEPVLAHRCRSLQPGNNDVMIRPGLFDRRHMEPGRFN
jgi:hypothetical protein